MKKNTIGNIISLKRKEKGLTQQELGNLLGVSFKTISKWECGNSYPDITILKEISKALDVSIEELLEGKITNIQDKNKKISPISKITLIILSLIVIIFILANMINMIIPSSIEKDTPKQQGNCTVIKTYNIKNIQNSNDGNYRYVTITEYQVEGAFTIKLPISIAKDLETDHRYVFTFKTSKENLNVQTDILFKNAEVINIKHTNKIGIESESKSYCDKE